MIRFGISMLSILIPTYNYNALPLVKTIEQQALKTGIVYELICIDDGSFSPLNKENQKINYLTNCKFIENIKNVGSFANRKLLAQRAQYDWLLFVDADVTPKHSGFLENYLSEFKNNADAVFGGFAYYNNKLNENKTLRYTFGKHREEVSAAIRNKNPYKVIISSNFIIKKQVLFKVNREDVINVYGLDYLFGALLKSKKIEVNHIDNEVYHLGIDDNFSFLEKTKNAIEALSYLHILKKVKSNSISLLKAYNILYFLGLAKLFGKVILKFNSKIETHLLSKNPHLFIFDLYRLGYFCKIKHP